jgi:FkbH-like protein
VITDLDDTLWHGIVGEVGADQVSWDLAGHHQEHGLYQNTLASLAAEGILVAVASKNDRAAVAAAFERQDLLLKQEQVFPLEVHWHAKSSSIASILRTWNVAADSVVFVDDSSMELAEVAAAHPDITCEQFPKGDPNAVLALLRRLRDLCGKPRILADDGLRLQSIRQAEQFRTAAEDAPEAFLAAAESAIRFDFDNGKDNPRVLELINKTNQFNLNGVRYTPAEWHVRLARKGAFVASVDYRDRFGPLGTIAILEGRQDGSTLYVGAWVMSCRAFSRRIEHQCLNTLFSRFGAQEIVLDFHATPKNGPLQDFLTEITGAPPSIPLTVTRAAFESRCKPLYHTVHATTTVGTSPQCTTQ